MCGAPELVFGLFWGLGHYPVPFLCLCLPIHQMGLLFPIFLPCQGHCDACVTTLLPYWLGAGGL